MRTLIVEKNTDLQALGASLLDARVSKGQAAAAMTRLKQLNPHVDPDKLTRGTVLFVPEAPGISASAGTSASESPRDEFQRLVEAALTEAAQDSETSLVARAAERKDVTSILKSAAFKRILASDELLKQQVDEATKAMAREEQEDKKAGETLAAASKAALAALAQLGKITG